MPPPPPRSLPRSFFTSVRDVKCIFDDSKVIRQVIPLPPPLPPRFNVCIRGACRSCNAVKKGIKKLRHPGFASRPPPPPVVKSADLRFFFPIPCFYSRDKTAYARFPAELRPKSRRGRSRREIVLPSVRS